MKVTILKGFESVQIKKFTMKETGEVKLSYFQFAYIDLGGAFPVQFRIPLESENHFYHVGEYSLSPDCFKVNQYGDLEINKYNLSLVPVGAI